MRRAYASTGEGVQSALRKKRLALAVGVCFVAVIIVVVLVRLGPPPEPRPVLDSALVTYNCTDLAATSLRAHADIIDDGGDWVTRRGFQYAVGGTGDLPDMIPLVNPSFEYGNPPSGWTYLNGSGNRTIEHTKAGIYSLSFTVDDDQWGSVLQSNPIPPEEVSERTITLGAWIWSDAPQRVRIFATHWVGESRNDGAGGYHPGDGEWHWLTLTVSFPTGVTAWNWRTVNVSPGPVISAYADGLCAVWGDELSAVFTDGEFGTGTYALDITALEPDTVCVIRAFAETRAGVSYGNTVTCRTPAA